MKRALLSPIVSALLVLALCAILSANAIAQSRPIPDKTPDPARTENFRSKRYGVLFHYLPGLQNRAEALNSCGKETSWDQCVSEFDVERFADEVARTGAGYIFFTVMQQNQYMCAPNSAFDRLTGYKPGEACSRRDLIAEIADALEKRGIDLYLYWTGDGPQQDPQASAGLKASYPVTAEFMRNWAEVTAEYGRRYGEKVKGWWVDGSFPFLHTEETLGILTEGLLAGNPNRIIAFNPGVDPEVMAYSIHDDFTAGEQENFTSVPESGSFIGGAQWHVLTYLGTWWASPGVKLTKKELAQYIWTVNRLGGVVTLDMMLFRDGSLDRSQLEAVKELRARLAEQDAEAAKAAESAPESDNLLAGGIPWSNEFVEPVPPPRFELQLGPPRFDPQLGIDGDLSTASVGNTWAWGYFVFLKQRRRAEKITVHFAPDGWASDFEILIKPADADWQSLGRFDNPEGETEFTVEFPVEEIDAVRVAGYKPDGPDQPGDRMAIAELEVY